MLLQKIILDDFGVYRGRNEFVVSSKQDKPIILLGGTNGAGKTTFFESLMLCLYGHKSIEPKITQKQYQQKILKSFHRYLGTGKASDESSITVEFQYAHPGVITEYKVSRRWENDKGTVNETLTIMKKNITEKKYTDLDSIEQSQWQLFIDQLLPFGITKLFFFDGEKIQNIAAARNEDEYIKASFDTLLGLDLVKQLHDDIGLFMLRNSDGDTRKILDDIENMNTEKKDAEQKLDNIREKQVFLQADIDGIQKKVNTYEEKFLKLGGMFAGKRQELKIKQAKLQSELDDTEKKIRSICSDTLPFALIPKQLVQLQDKIRTDMKILESKFEKNILEKSYTAIRNNLKLNEKFTSYTPDVQKELLEQLDKSYNNYCDALSRVPKTTFNFSINDMIHHVKFIDKINATSKKDIETLAKKHSQLLHELKLINESLDIAPQDDEIGVIFSDITRENRNIGELAGELDHLKSAEAQEKTMITMLNAKIRQNLVKRKIDSRRISGIEIAPKVQDALQEYAVYLRKTKIELLESYILDGIKRMFHKKDFIQKVSINQDTFEVKMYNGTDEITSDKLSQGELQMYATAIVWGLAKTSGRPIPFIIDTPLARLDVKHRENLIDAFFPFASHQTIILSTDSEITQQYHNKLEPYISKSIIIKYDSTQGRTIQSDGYFEENKIEV